MCSNLLKGFPGESVHTTKIWIPSLSHTALSIEKDDFTHTHTHERGVVEPHRSNLCLIMMFLFYWIIVFFLWELNVLYSVI